MADRNHLTLVVPEPEPEPEPTITIVAHKVLRPGHPEGYELHPQLAFTAMPGSWVTVHRLLCLCLNLVADRMVSEVQQQRITVATELPDGHDLLRQ
jgi:hypothetical protein